MTIRRSLVAFASLLLCWCWLATPAEGLGIQLAWKYRQNAPPASQATSFNVHRQAGCAGAFVWLANVPVRTRRYTDTAIEPGATYCWQVTAVDAEGGESVPSNTLTFQVPPAPGGLAAPTRLRGTLIP